MGWRTARFRSKHAWYAELDVDDTVQKPACSTESLDKAVDYKLKQAKKTPYMDDCHLVPQAEYYNSGVGCKHVIKQEHFEHEFSDLLGRFGIAVNVAKTKEKKLSTNCHADFSPEALEKIHEFYSEDYSAFGYKKNKPVKKHDSEKETKP